MKHTGLRLRAGVAAHGTGAMCGIVGMVCRDRITPDHVERIADLNRLLTHRGPDDAGEFHDDAVALAMRRLSIIDLESGAQPLYNEDKSVVLVANGEVYNFIELRAALEAQGHRFRTGSDCETICHLYEAHGTAFVHHLRGMYAFALWDRRKRRLVLGRDRMGEKPLYLYEQEGRLYFASEFKVLLRSGLVPFELDPRGVDLYFHYGFVPEPATPIKGVRKLPAGHLLTVDIDPWSVEETCYWRLEDAPPLEGEPAPRIAAVLDEVGELTIRSDVPVGVALSGGLDSSVVAAMVARRNPGNVHAFTIGYVGEPRQDERRDARRLADHLDMPFHDFEVDRAAMIRDFSRMVRHRDDPILDIAGHNYYTVCRLARDHGVPVMMFGQGGDELFWGYNWVTKAVRDTMRKQALVEGGASLKDYLRLTPPPRSPYGLYNWLKIGGGLRTGWLDYRRDRSASPDQMVFFDMLWPGPGGPWRQIRRQYAPGFRDRVRDDWATAPFTTARPWPKVDVAVTRLICQTYLLANGIAQGDRLSMASSVEVRLPLLDYRLVETVIGLRKTHEDFKLGAKTWFKQAVRDLLPSWAMTRPKRGFNPPVRQWIKALLGAQGGDLSDGVLVGQGVLDGRRARRLGSEPASEYFVRPLSLAALVLETWCREMQP